MAKIQVSMRFGDQIIAYFTDLGKRNSRNFNNQVEVVLMNHIKRGIVLQKILAEYANEDGLTPEQKKRRQEDLKLLSEVEGFFTDPGATLFL